jgi:hypothetical protein
MELMSRTRITFMFIFDDEFHFVFLVMRELSLGVPQNTKKTYRK